MANPNVVVDALLAGPIMVGPVRIGPLMVAHYLVLERRQHPAVTRENPELSTEEWVELAFVLGSPADVVAEASNDAACWSEALLRFAETIPLDRLTEIRSAVQRQLQAAFAPAPPPQFGSSEKKSPDNLGMSDGNG